MCGIVGTASTSPVNHRDLWLTMRDTLAHRGPDDAGLWSAPDQRVVFGHRRLSIVDLSSAGHQPMADCATQAWITFNGEIYNYRDLRHELELKGHQFRTATDTEVVLEAYRAWGLDCLSHLNGMFAFALYDETTRRVFVARDRAGEKPLFYRHAANTLSFASELKALMADGSMGRTLDLEALELYLTYGYVPGTRCLVRGARKLAPGHAMTFDLASGALHIWQYWKLPEPDVSPNVSADELTAELDSLLEDAVRRQLVADVPVGILLSGGLDSSLITAMAARVSSQAVKTFTIAFPGHGAFDESPHARIVARHFRTEHIELAAEPASVELLPILARQYDEPIADSSIVPSYLVSRLVRQHATVALGGDGGDELFGGYPHYSWIQQHEHIRRYIPSWIRRAVGAAAGGLLPTGVRGRNYVIGFTADLAYSIAHVNVYFDRWTRDRLLAPLRARNRASAGAPERFRAGLCGAGHSILRQATEADFRSTMVDGYLVKVDRASMLNSLEVRLPWLDHRLIEFAFARVPDHLRATESDRKILVRRLAARLLPPELDLQRKQGFSMPLHAWFKGEWGTYMEAVLRDADEHLFDAASIRSLVDGQHRGRANTARLFALTMFELWRREYRITY
jgi:asparagine synthase (glutamine-hydrolysing)